MPKDKTIFTVRVSTDTPDVTPDEVFGVLQAAVCREYGWLHVDYVIAGDGKQR